MQKALIFSLAVAGVLSMTNALKSNANSQAALSTEVNAEFLDLEHCGCDCEKRYTVEGYICTTYHFCMKLAKEVELAN